MSRLTAIVSSIMVGLLAIFIWTLGRNLIMPLADAKEKGVGAGPWFLVWGMIAITALCSASLIAFLVATTRRSPSRR